MTQSGGALWNFNGGDRGVLFEYDVATNVYTKKFDFSDADGSRPTGSLIKASNGMLYGMTSRGGANNLGVLFEYDAATNVYTRKFDFSYSDGIFPYGSLKQASNGKLYGMTSSGGANGKGVLFEYDFINNVYIKKLDFSGSTGHTPQYGNLIEVNLTPNCISSTIPTLAATNSSICIGSSSSLSISSGSLNGATNWQWYRGSCAGIAVGSGTSITVTPASTTTYYARGEGVCVTPGICASITITVEPNVNPGTVTGSSPLCINATATYSSSGNAGGVWSSSNNSVATVDAASGLVTAVAAGTATITYTLNSGCGFPLSASAALTVDPSANAGSVTGSSPLCINATATYSSSGNTGGVWSSSNNSVATVDAASGLVTAVAAGTATITYTLNSGCGAPASSTASVTVNLTVNAGTVTGSSPLCINGTATYSSSGSTGGVWSSSNNAIATVDAASGLVTAVAAGTAIITYTLNSGCGAPVSTSAALTVDANVNTGTVTGSSPLCINGTATYSSSGDAGGVWSSSNNTIATVDAASGLVTAVAAGTAIITYTLNSGCGAPVSTSATVNVNPNVNPGTVTGADSVYIGTTVAFSSNGDAGGTWSSSNPAVSTVDAISGLATANSAGTTQIIYTLNSGCGSPVYALSNFVVKVPEDFTVNIFPNPSESTASLKVLSADNVNQITVRIIDPTGKVLNRFLMMPGTVKRLDGVMIAGIYYIEVIQGGNRVVKKWIRL
jgi:uncharacterized repeat protein (TIGR03803 family)